MMHMSTISTFVEAISWVLSRAFIECCRHKLPSAAVNMPNKHYITLGKKETCTKYLEDLHWTFTCFFPSLEWSWDHLRPNVHPPWKECTCSLWLRINHLIYGCQTNWVQRREESYKITNQHMNHKIANFFINS